MLMAVGPRAASVVLIKKSYVSVCTSDLTHKKLCVSHPHDNAREAHTQNWKLITANWKLGVLVKLESRNWVNWANWANWATVARRGASGTARSLYA